MIYRFINIETEVVNYLFFRKIYYLLEEILNLDTLYTEENIKNLVEDLKLEIKKEEDILRLYYIQSPTEKMIINFKLER